MKFFPSLLKMIESLFSPYGDLITMGFEARIYNSDFILSKKSDHYQLHLHQSLEPHNKKWDSLITFEHYDACIVIEFFDRRRLQVDEENLKKVCQNYYDYGGFIFLFNNDMEFDTKNFKRLVEQIEFHLSPL